MPQAKARGIDFTEELSPTFMVSAAVRALSTNNLANVHKLRGARILVAEDNQTNQRVTQMILESGGHVVTIVDNGEDALDALERGGFELALIDLSMPVVSGLEALKLYRFSTRNPIPILILSANVTTEIIDECMRSGAAEFVTKPIRASVLLDAVERNLEIEPVLNMLDAPQVRLEDRPSLQVVDTPPVDASVLADLGRLSQDPTFVDRLIHGFRGDTERIVGEIVDALAHRKYEKVKDAAHALKGGAASVGATQLTQVASRLEKATHDALRMKAAQWTENLLRTSTRTLDALELHLEERRNRTKFSS